MSKGTINKVILVGRLGADPRRVTSANGCVISNLTVATNYTCTNKHTGGNYR